MTPFEILIQIATKKHQQAYGENSKKHKTDVENV